MNGVPRSVFQRLDEQGQQANERLDSMERTFTNGSEPDIAIADALRAIAAQMNYANCIAACAFAAEHSILEDDGHDD